MPNQNTYSVVDGTEASCFQPQDTHRSTGFQALSDLPARSDREPEKGIEHDRRGGRLVNGVSRAFRDGSALFILIYLLSFAIACYMASKWWGVM